MTSSALTPVVGPDRGPSGVLVFGLIVVVLLTFIALARIGQNGGTHPTPQGAFAGPAATGPGASSRVVPLLTHGPSPSPERIPGAPPPRVSETIRPVAVCPPGSTPDAPGPAAQDRPPLAWGWPMAFDRRAARIVVLAGLRQLETWTFDVCTNTWLKMHPDVMPPSGWWRANQLTYDEESGRTILVDTENHRVWAYDLEADAWTEEGRPTVSIGRWPWFVYDPVSGLEVALDSTAASTLYAYDDDDDAWSTIRQANAFEVREPGRVQFAYDASVDRFIAYDTGPSGTWLFDRRTGTWDRSSAATPVVNLGYGATSVVIAYDEAISRTIVFSDGLLIAFDAATAHWDVLDDASETSHLDGFNLATGPTARMGHSVVYDPVNERIVVYGGQYRTTDPSRMWVQADDVLAFDPVTREWSTLLEASTVQTPPG